MKEAGRLGHEAITRITVVVVVVVGTSDSRNGESVSECLFGQGRVRTWTRTKAT